MVEKKEWSEFRNTGLLLLINQVLHVFGWAIVIEVEHPEETDKVLGLEEKIVAVYPARVKFRGFDNDSVTKAYRKISEYMNDNAAELLKEASE
jgi:hypothetical protein